ncbi:hypothetical protein [Photobacterium sp. R1]
MSNKPLQMSEEEMARVGAIFFKAQGWELFPEVDIPIFPGRPDHVGLRGEMVSVIEYKKSLTYEVLEQLTRWHHHFEDASERHENQRGVPHLLIAVSQRLLRPRPFSRLKRDLMTRYRLGYYEIEKRLDIRHGRRAEFPEGVVYKDHGHNYVFFNEHRYELFENIPPRLQQHSRATANRIKQHLNQDMKMGTPGVTGQKNAYMSEFKRTMEKVRTVLERGGDWHIDTIIDVINSELDGHHYCSYSSAKSGITAFITKMNIGVKLYDNRPVYRLWTDEQEAVHE